MNYSEMLAGLCTQSKVIWAIGAAIVVLGIVYLNLMAEAFAAVVDVGKAIAAALSGRYAAHVRDLSSSGECPAGFARQTRPGIFFAGSRHRRRLNQCLRVGEYLLRSPRIATA
jgi:hypothetical protein